MACQACLSALASACCAPAAMSARLAQSVCSWLQIADKKLKGRMQHTERLNSEAAVAAAKTDEWLLPAEAGTLEAEGMERTWRFSQVCLSARLAQHIL